MKSWLIFLIVGITAGASAQSSNITAMPSLCLGASCSSVLDDSTLAIEPLKPEEVSELEAAEKQVATAEERLADLKSKLSTAHGATTVYSYGCGENMITSVEIHGKYAFKTKHSQSSCFAIAD